MAIKVNTKELIFLPVDALNEFQGELKELLEEDYAKLRTELIEHGINFVLHIWLNPADDKYYILDGHQRKRTLTRVRDTEHMTIPDVPCVVVEAESYEKAKHMVMQAVSQYGRVTNDGLYSFMNQADIGIEELESRFRIPDFDVDMFKKNFFVIDTEEISLINNNKDEFIVSVHCKNETEQKNVYEELKTRGLICKLIM